MSELSLQTRVARGVDALDTDTRSVTPPLYPGASFERAADLSYREGRAYTRSDNPTYDPVHELLTALEGGASSQLFASGMAAAAAIFQTLRPGERVVHHEGVYRGVQLWLERHGKRAGIETTVIGDNDLAALRATLKERPCALVWVESPANPNWGITDLRAFAEAAHEVGATVVVDNTVSTPVLTRPLDLGADLVMHSATKYLNGHGDLLAGALVTRHLDERWQTLQRLAHDGGALPGSFEAWLLLRGMRTLFLRMERICANAMAVAAFLDGHPAVRQVAYPGLPDMPGHEIARRQMQGGFGGMLSFRLAGGREAALRVQAAVQVFRRACSLGMTSSLIEHRASYEGEGTRAPDDLLRLSIGIEQADDLVEDLRQALEHA